MRRPDFWNAGKELLDSLLPANHAGVRLLGVGVSRFRGERLVQPMLFYEEEGEGQRRQRQLGMVTDAVSDRVRGSSLSQGTVQRLPDRE